LDGAGVVRRKIRTSHFTRRGKGLAARNAAILLNLNDFLITTAKIPLLEYAYKVNKHPKRRNSEGDHCHVSIEQVAVFILALNNIMQEKRNV